MLKQTAFPRIFNKRGSLIAGVVVGAMLFGVALPASAQFFPFGQSSRSGNSGGGFFAPFRDTFGPPLPQQQQQAPKPADASRAPPPAKRDEPAARNVLVLGDAMADWLAYGLEETFSESPEIGVIRKHKTVSGLIRYQPKGDPLDWAAAAKGILATEKPSVIVVMLGLNDRTPIREADVKGDKPLDAKKGVKKDARSVAKPVDAKPVEKPQEPAAAPAAKPDELEIAPDDEDDPSAVPDKAARTANGVYDFRDERWVELYTKKIEEMIAVLKSKGVPVLWVGLPAVRGPKATSDMLYLDALYRDAAGKAGITYVDVWDGFVDESGRFLQEGPDFEGQIRRLRSYDGVYFTRAGARKLAHYTEREIRRVLATPASLVALPSESFSPGVNIRPGAAGPRPLTGPVVPLIASAIATDELLGGTGTRPASVDALAARTLVKGEALAAPAGRADDFSWPRRDIGKLEGVANEPEVAATPEIPKAKKKPAAPPQQAAAARPPTPPRDGFFLRPPGNAGSSGFFFFPRW